MTVTVVVPTYNRGSEITETIDCLLANSADGRSKLRLSWLHAGALDSGVQTGLWLLPTLPVCWSSLRAINYLENSSGSLD
jgi:hypothetical protein